MRRRRKNGYFEMVPDAPKPVSACVERRCQFSEVDPLTIAWHGRYVTFFEEAATELGHKCGLTYEAFRAAKIAAPIAQLHVDYHQPLRLNERFEVKASVVWCEEAKLNTEFIVTREDGVCACTGYTVQLFVEADSKTLCVLPPRIILDFREKWKHGDFDD